MQIDGSKFQKCFITGIAIVLMTVLSVFLSIVILLIFGLEISCKDRPKFYCPAVHFAALGIVIFSEIKLEISDLINPDIKVFVEDDGGNIREGLLNDKVASSRNVKKGDKIRLACEKFTLNKVPYTNCELRFSSFDRMSPYPKNNPLYGIYPSYSINLDEKGMPKEGQVLRYLAKE